MIISVNWLKKFTPINGTIDELATLIGARLVEIESVVALADKYKDVVVVKVVTCEPLKDSDHLNVTKIDDNGVTPDVERDDNGYVQVVCGAPNVHAGMFAAWLPPKSVVPETYATDAPFVLSAKPLRGVLSNGMLASARELDLFDDHTGILEIDKDTTPGSSFAQLYELDDYLLLIENKSLTHRPDTFGIIGFAREVAAIQGTPFHTPEWLQRDVRDDGVRRDADAAPHDNAPRIAIDDPSLSDRFQAVVLSTIDNAALSPLQRQTYLARSGVRPINAAVDISNYLMLLTGQPSHTYDYNKVLALAGDDATLHVRTATQGETLQLLDGKVVTLDPADIVIAAGDTPVGLAGIMGGASTAVDASTTALLLEVATFDLYHLRASQMRHGIFSEAITRFTKGIPAALSAPVLAKAVALLQQQTGAVVASAVADVYPGKQPPVDISIRIATINAVLGTTYDIEAITALLRDIECAVTVDSETLHVTVPYWRHDLHIQEDIIEEVGRIKGYDTINLALPQRTVAAVEPRAFDQLQSTLRRFLVRTGANEVLTYSFIHGDIMKKVGQDPENAYRVTNSISPSLQYYRQSLVPSLLSHVTQNSKAGYDSFALFECNKVHQKSDGYTDESVPVEHHHVAYTIIDTKKKQTAAYYEAKEALRYTLFAAGYSGLRFVPLHTVPADTLDASYAPFEPKRSALVMVDGSDEPLGVVGEFSVSVRRAFKLPWYCAGFEMNPEVLLDESVLAAADAHAYAPLSKYPRVERDICFQVPRDCPYETIFAAATDELAHTPYSTTVEPLDIYQDESSEVKNITLRIGFVSYDKTLTGDEVTAAIVPVIAGVIEKTDGKVI